MERIESRGPRIAIGASILLSSLFFVNCSRELPLQEFLSTSNPLATSQACRASQGTLPQQTKRLTLTQIENSLKNAFGETIGRQLIVPDLQDGNPTFGLTSDPSYLSLNEINYSNLLTAADGWTSLLSTQYSPIRDCLAASSSSCYQSLIADLGPKLWRRPLEASEISNIMTAINQTGVAGSEQRRRSMVLLVSALTLSPHHLNRIELGDITSGSYLFKLTPYEVASFLSFSLWDYPPDQELYDLAAEGNTLLESDVLQGQIRRMQLDPRFQYKMAYFYYDLLKLGNVNTATKAASLNFTNSQRQALLASAMQSLAASLAQPDADIMTPFSMTSFTSNSIAYPFIQSGATPSGMTASVSAEVPLRSNERFGILSHPAFLTSISGVETSGIVKRGVFTLEQLMCYHLGQVPAEIPGVEDLPPGFDPSRETSRRVLEVTHSAQATCITCHSSIDPTGGAYENFDNLGRFRIVEKGSIPIDSSGTISAPFREPLRYTNSVEYLRGLAQKPEFKDCIQKHFYHFIIGRHPTSSPEAQCEYDQFKYATQQSGGKLGDALTHLLTLPSVTERRPASTAGGQ